MNDLVSKVECLWFNCKFVCLFEKQSLDEKKIKIYFKYIKKYTTFRLTKGKLGYYVTCLVMWHNKADFNICSLQKEKAVPFCSIGIPFPIYLAT